MSNFTTPFLEDKSKNERAVFFTQLAIIALGMLALIVIFQATPAHAQASASGNQLQSGNPFTVLANFLKTIVTNTRGVVSGLVIIFATLAIFSIISGARSPQSKSMAISWLFWVLGGYVIYMLLPTIITFVEQSILAGGGSA